MHTAGMGITVLHVEDCPSLGLLRPRLTEALERVGVAATHDERVVAADDDAIELGFGGSPTILIDGRDPFPADSANALTCRLYPTPSGWQGAPTVDQLVEVLAS